MFNFSGWNVKPTNTNVCIWTELYPDCNSYSRLRTRLWLICRRPVLLGRVREKNADSFPVPALLFHAASVLFNIYIRLLWVEVPVNIWMMLSSIFLISITVLTIIQCLGAISFWMKDSWLRFILAKMKVAMLWNRKYFQGLVSSVTSLSIYLSRFLSGCPETLRISVLQWSSLREPFGSLKYYCVFHPFFFLPFKKEVSSVCASPGDCSPNQFGRSQTLGNWQLQ